MNLVEQETEVGTEVQFTFNQRELSFVRMSFETKNLFFFKMK